MHASLVVVAAHPDDETVGAASALLRAAEPAVIHLTDGAPRDPGLRPRGSDDRAAYARVRREEALAALAVAGLRPRQVIALGGVDQEAVRDLARLARELGALLLRLDPEVVVAHPLEGGHPDHDAAAVAARAAVALLVRRGARAPLLVEMTSYHRARGALVTGAFLPGSPPGWRRRLAPGEREAKRRMLDGYVTQREVLAPFGTEEERFRRARTVSLASPPHPSPLHYEAMGWTTFDAFSALAGEALAALGLRPERLPAGTEATC